MPDDPEYGLSYQHGVQGHSPVFGTEYEQVVVPNRNSGNAVCAVCYVPNKMTSIMIPAKYNCSSGWTREYYGYLMSTSVHNHYRTHFVCVDNKMGYVPGSRPDSPAAMFYHKLHVLDCLVHVTTLKKNSTVWCAPNRTLGQDLNASKLKH